MEGQAMMWKRVSLGVALAAGLALTPLAGAQARGWGWHHGPGFWPFWAGAAVVGAATAPLWAWPRYYYPPSAYYYYPPAPAYYTPGYYAYYR
jgi:hypothetical protein